MVSTMIVVLVDGIIVAREVVVPTVSLLIVGLSIA